jgi:putative membrane protein
MNKPAVFTLALLLLFLRPAPSLAVRFSPTQPDSSAHKSDDATIFAIFDEVNSADIATARLGLKKAQSPKVRALARMVASDHEQVQQMARDLARKLSVVPAPPDNDKSPDELARTLAGLQEKSGTDFDRSYLLHEIEFHRSAIEAVKTKLLPAIQNEEFKTLVRNVLPGLEHHLAETEEVARSLDYK